MSCTSHRACEIQNHLKANVRTPDSYWHPSLLALAVKDSHPGLNNMVLCTQYSQTPARAREMRLEFAAALEEVAGQEGEPFWFPIANRPPERVMAILNGAD